MFNEGKKVPDDAVRLYRMVWQLEKWLRAMVYVELRSRDEKWEDAIKIHTRGWPPSSIKSDKQLHHMATAHQSVISYLSLGELWNIIVDANNWILFEPYFPPRDNTEARIKEVMGIRNRIMHFREPNENDVSRMELFLKDFEAGVRLFCQSYKTPYPNVKSIEQDPLGKILYENWVRIGYGVELDFLHIGWLYAPPPYRMNPKVGATLCLLRRPWADKDDEGFLYKLSLTTIAGRHQINIEKMLETTESVHEKCIHVIIEGFQYCEFSVIIPEHLGAEENADTIADILKAAINCGIGRSISEKEAIAISRCTPEYVLWPDNPLVWYDDSISENIIEL